MLKYKKCCPSLFLDLVGIHECVRSNKTIISGVIIFSWRRAETQPVIEWPLTGGSRPCGKLLFIKPHSDSLYWFFSFFFFLVTMRKSITNLRFYHHWSELRAAFARPLFVYGKLARRRSFKAGSAECVNAGPIGRLCWFCVATTTSWPVILRQLLSGVNAAQSFDGVRL